MNLRVLESDPRRSTIAKIRHPIRGFRSVIDRRPVVCTTGYQAPLLRSESSREDKATAMRPDISVAPACRVRGAINWTISILPHALQDWHGQTLHERGEIPIMFRPLDKLPVIRSHNSCRSAWESFRVSPPQRPQTLRSPTGDSTIAVGPRPD